MRAVGNPSRRAGTARVVCLVLLASVGLVAVHQSQIPAGSDALSEGLTWSATAGVVLALMSGVLAAVSVAASLAYAGVVHERLVSRPGIGVVGAVEDSAGLAQRRLVLWLSALGHLIARTVSLPFIVVAGAATFIGQPALDSRGLAGAGLLGAIVCVASLLLRVGNIASRVPSANVVLLWSPVLGLAILAVLGISLPCVEMFAAGAAMILAASVLGQRSMKN